MPEIKDTVEIEETSQQPQQQPALQQQSVGCTGDCKRCHEAQRGYCASQIAFNMQNAVARVEMAVAALSQNMAVITANIEALQARLDAMERASQAPELFTPEQPVGNRRKSKNEK